MISQNEAEYFELLKRRAHERDEYKHQGEALGAVMDCNRLIRFCERLVKRMPKKITKDKLRTEHEKRYSVRSDWREEAVKPWVECAEFLGMLEKE